MRAVRARGFGGVEVLEVAEVAVPAAGPGQVRIRVEAATVNPVDLATRSGALTEAGLLPERDLVGLGWDVAGVVAEIGAGVSGFAMGDRVVGLSDRLDVTLGTHADQVVLDATAVARAPAGVPAVAAATLPLNGLTAAQALDRLGLGEGQSLLVTGAAGAVGGFAVQLAAGRGLRVAAVAGEDDEELVRAMGAEWFVPRSVARLGAAVREFVPAGLDGAVDAAVLGTVALDAVRGGGVRPPWKRRVGTTKLIKRPPAAGKVPCRRAGMARLAVVIRCERSHTNVGITAETRPLSPSESRASSRTSKRPDSCSRLKLLGATSHGSAFGGEFSSSSSGPSSDGGLPWASRCNSSNASSSPIMTLIHADRPAPPTEGLCCNVPVRCRLRHSSSSSSGSTEFPNGP